MVRKLLFHAKEIGDTAQVAEGLDVFTCIQTLGDFEEGVFSGAEGDQACLGAD